MEDNHTVLEILNKSASALALNLSQQGSDRAPPLLNLRQI